MNRTYVAQPVQIQCFCFCSLEGELLDCHMVCADVDGSHFARPVLV